MPEPLLVAESIGKTYGAEIKTRALCDVSFEMEAGDFAAVIGKSGSGKSTLLNLLGLLDTPTDGTLRLNGRDAGAASKRERARMRNESLGFIFQFHHLLPEFSVRENLLMPGWISGKAPDATMRAQANETLAILGLEDMADKNANALSGGQKQRVAIGRALMNRPQLVLADEPTGNLDTENTDAVYALFRRINAEWGTTFLIVTHDNDIASMTDRILEIRDGRLVQDARNAYGKPFVEAVAADVAAPGTDSRQPKGRPEMGDWQPPQQGQPPQPPAPAYAPPQAYQPPPPGYPPQAGGPYPPGEPPKKKRTGLIVAVVLISLLLLCCCSGVAGLILFRASSSTSTGTISLGPSELEQKKAEEKDLAARAAAWELVKLSFVKGDYTLVDPNERQRRLAEATIAQVLPDFAIEELTIDPGRYDKAKDYFYFDTAFVTLVASDATIRTAYSFDIETPEAEASGMTKEKLDLGESDAVIQLEGKTWVIYPTGSKEPLLGGMKDPAYGVLIRQAGEDWPGGLPTKFVDQADGSVVVSVETWDSYRFSDDWNRIEATYVRSGTGWKVTTYKPIIESGNSDEASPTV